VKAVIRNLQAFYRTNAFVLNSLVKYGFGLAVLSVVVALNWSGLVKVFSNPIRFGPLLLAAAISIVGLMITFLRWHLLAQAVDVQFSRYNAVRLGLLGYFYSTFLPSSVGGDIVKAYAIAREQDRRTRAITTVGIDRVIGLWALFWFVAIIGFVFWRLDHPILQNPNLWAIITFSWIFVGASMTIWMAAGLLSEERADRLATWLEGIRKIGGSLAEFWRACWMYRKKSRYVLIAMLMSLVGHAGWVLVFDLSVHAFETPNPEMELGTFYEHMVIVPVGMTVSGVVPVPGGIGVGEAAYGQLYKFAGRPMENGVAGCMLQRGMFICLAILGYVVFLVAPARNGSKVEASVKAAGDVPLAPAPVKASGVVLRVVGTDS
jgi:glycosyltransferase 2 family protein